MLSASYLTVPKKQNIHIHVQQHPKDLPATPIPLPSPCLLLEGKICHREHVQSLKYILDIQARYCVSAIYRMVMSRAMNDVSQPIVPLPRSKTRGSRVEETRLC